MLKAGLYAGQARDHFVKVAKRVGVFRALAHKLTGVTYSGPEKTYVGLLGYDRNDAKSLEMAIRLGASRINDTWIAKHLQAWCDTNPFRPVYEPYLKRRGTLSKLGYVIQAAYNTVWSGISIAFARLPFREIATAVCGTNKKRVFFRYELPELVKNKSIKICNKIPMEAVRRMFYEVGKDEAFNLVCLSELQMAFRYSISYTHRFKRAKRDYAENDYAERLAFYQGERKKTAPKRPALTSDQEHRKQQIIADFGLKHLYDIAP